MSRKYKVSFEIEGDAISDDVPLTKDTIEELIINELDLEESNYYHRVYSSVSNLVIEQVKKGE